MRFDFDAYSKVYPEKEEAPEIESAVETFTPTQKEAEGSTAGEDLSAIPPEPEKTPEPVKEPETAIEPEGEQNE